MQTIKIQLPKRHDAQNIIYANIARFTILNCGRRFGKNILDKHFAVDTMLQGQPVGWFEPTYKYLAEIWRDICATILPITKSKSEQEHRVDLITGGSLEMWTLENKDAGVGRHYKRVIINEAAKVANLEYSWGYAIRPTLADLKGDAIFSSTPKGLNFFYSLWQRAEDSPDWRRFHFTTYDNPKIEKSEIDAMRDELPERVFRQEIMAEFIEDGAFFQGVDQAAVIAQPDKPDEHAGHFVVAGLDFALSEDYTVLTIGCRDCNKVIAWDRFNQIDYIYQRDRIIKMCQKYHVDALLPERNSIGGPNIELLRQSVRVASGQDGAFGFNTTATTKPALIMKLASGLQTDGFKVPADYADELRSYQVEITSSNPKFSAPSGMHDDRVMSLALCWWAMTMYSRHGGIHA